MQEPIYDAVSPNSDSISRSSSSSSVHYSLSSFEQFTSGHVPPNANSHANSSQSAAARSRSAMSAELAQQKQELGERLFPLVRALQPSTLPVACLFTLYFSDLSCFVLELDYREGIIIIINLIQ